MSEPTSTPTRAEPRSGLRRQTVRAGTWLLRAFALWVLLQPVVDVPRALFWLVVMLLLVSATACTALAPRPPERARVEVDVPVRGTWVALNSPGSRVPAHGTRAYGQAYAIDVLVPAALEPADAEHGRPRLGWGVGARPQEFPAFGAPVHAAAAGTVVATGARQRDHRARNTWAGLPYLTVEGLVREVGGVRFILGNHVVVDQGDGVWAVYAHLRRGSVAVRPGDAVVAGQRLGEVGNTGNTSEPHLHFQLMDRPDPVEAAGVPFRWRGAETDHGVVAPRYGLPRDGEGAPGLPGNGQVFHAGPR